MYLLFQKRFAIYVCNMIITVRQSCMCVCVCVCVCVWHPTFPGNYRNIAAKEKCFNK